MVHYRVLKTSLETHHIVTSQHCASNTSSSEPEKNATMKRQSSYWKRSDAHSLCWRRKP